MSEITVVRTADRIAGEINLIKSQTSAILDKAFTAATNGIFEIGKRLEEVKALVPFGSWGKWLEDNVQYSESTANNLMRIYREYGGEQVDLFTGKTPREVFEGLSQSQLVALFALPEPERVEYVEAHRDEMTGGQSIRELQREIEKYKEKNAELADRVEHEVKAAENATRLYADVVAEKAKLSAEKDKLATENGEMTAKVLQMSIGLETAEEKLEATKAELEAERNKPPVVKTQVQVEYEVSPEKEQEIREQINAEWEEKMTKKTAQNIEDTHKLEEKLTKQIEKGKKDYSDLLKQWEDDRASLQKEINRAKAQSGAGVTKVQTYLAEVARYLTYISEELDEMGKESPDEAGRMRRRCYSMLSNTVEERFGGQG